MKILLSIKPEFVEKIFSGEKRFEYRKAIFKNNDVTSVVIYATMPVGMIVGEFKIKSVHKDTPRTIWQETQKYSGVSEDFFFSYFNNKNKAYAIEIGEIRRYENPVNPQKLFPHFTAPQSFCYIKTFNY